MASAFIVGGNNITGNNGNGIDVNASSVQIGGATIGDLVGLPVATISGNGVAVLNGSGVSGFNGASILIRQTTISGNTGRGVTLSLQSRANMFDNVTAPAVSVTGNTGFGLFCSGPESSFAGNPLVITGNTAGQINAACTGF